MRFEAPLYKSLKHHMAGHGQWHLARLPKAWIDPEDRPKWQQARDNVLKHHPGLVSIEEPGAGRQFLQFHRDMIRQLLWLVNDLGNKINYRFAPWKGLPPWLAARYAPEEIEAMTLRIDKLVKRGTADDLGNFIEATELDKSLGASMHNRAHGIVAEYERAQDSTGKRWHDAAMDNFDTAHHNEMFWCLHGWIDDIYMRWQVAHGERPDRSPMPPHDHHRSETPFVMPDSAIAIFHRLFSVGR